MNIFPADFSGYFGLDSCFVTNEAEDGVGWVFGELADELELDDGVHILVTRSCVYSSAKSLRRVRVRLQ